MSDGVLKVPPYRSITSAVHSDEMSVSRRTRQVIARYLLTNRCCFIPHPSSAVRGIRNTLASLTETSSVVAKPVASVTSVPCKVTASGSCDGKGEKSYKSLRKRVIISCSINVYPFSAELHIVQLFLICYKISKLSYKLIAWNPSRWRIFKGVNIYLILKMFSIFLSE